MVRITRLSPAIAGLLVLSLGLAGWSKEAPSAAARPNIVLCMADDQGWGDTGYNGHPQLKTPVLDAMAASGLRFDRFYAAAPVCSPTRGSVLTGRHPNRFGDFRWGYTLRPQEVTIAEALKRAGYVTGHFGKWHLGPVRADSPVCPGNSGFDQWFSSPNFYDNNPLMSRNGKVVHTHGESSIVTAQAAMTFIADAVRRKQAFLAVIWFGSPHSPHQAADEYLAMYKDLPKDLQNYYGEITAMDRAVGMVRRQLREMGVADRTLFWYTSDNGAQGPGSTGGLSGKKGSLWEGGIRVPAIIEWPEQIPSPRTTAVPCGTVDIYPTLLDIVGVKVPNQPKPLDGISLTPLLRGAMATRPKPLGFWNYPAPGRPVRSTQLLEELEKEQKAAAAGQRVESKTPAENPGAITQHYSDRILPGYAAWIDNDYKLHRDADKNGKATYHLFNLAADPKEQNDLAEKDLQRVQRMKAQLESWQKSVIRSLNGEDYVSR